VKHAIRRALEKGKLTFYVEHENTLPITATGPCEFGSYAAKSASVSERCVTYSNSGPE
jgi:hypothetical protein